MFLTPIQSAVCLAAVQFHGQGVWVGGESGVTETMNLPGLSTEAILLGLMACLREHSKMLVKQSHFFPESLSGTKLMYLILY